LWYAARVSSHEPPPTPLETCTTHGPGRALRLLGDAPTLLIIWTDLQGTHRFGEVRLAMADISPKTIAQRLLEALDFVRRQAFAEIPPCVECDLTEKGHALAGIMAAIKEFGERYLANDMSSAAHGEIAVALAASRIPSRLTALRHRHGAAPHRLSTRPWRPLESRTALAGFAAPP